MRDIAKRQSICTLCELIASAETIDLVDHADAPCELVDDWLYRVRTQEGNAQYENWIYGVSVRLNPNVDKDVFGGPYLPTSLSTEVSQEPRFVVELQPHGVPGHHGNFQESCGLGRIVDDEVSFEVLRQWPKRCVEMHSACREHWNASVDSATPTTSLIDVKNMCLVHSLSSYRYVALSYVCGATTAKINVALSKGIDLYRANSLRGLDLPATIQDAMTVIREVGEHYLWVDALCIPQNDFSARAKQISEMDVIYKQAAFTIVAAAGADADYGLPGVRPGTRQTKQRSVTLGDTAFLTFIDDANYKGVSDTTWSQRAWTLQEDVFSRRRLVWTEKQIYWICPEAQWLEESKIEDLSLESMKRLLHQRPLSELIEYKDYWPGTPPSQRQQDQQRYADLRNAFLERNITYPSDMLNAFTGITRALSLEENTQFIFGLKESFFSSSLLWAMPARAQNNASGRMEMDDGTFKDIVFPSWSWSAWQVPLEPFAAYWAVFGETFPVLSFYHCSATDGRWTKIHERDSPAELPSPHAQHWLSQPRFI